tara:strand:+ start:3875 stop:4255 length:381 start_codon:yes stop_codon:yes gene_type:complete
MLEAVEENGLIRIRASGTLKSSDFDRFVPLFERIAALEPRSVPMLIELAPDFSGWELGGLWRELKFDVKHQDKFGRIAIVGDKNWQEWGTKLSNPLFPSADQRFFGPAEIDTAETWARTGRQGNAT